MSLIAFIQVNRNLYKLKKSEIKNVLVIRQFSISLKTKKN